MIDCSCTHETFAEALQIGHACDENHLFWLEDPFIDGGVSQFAHKKLREMIKTPLLIAEHVRTLEQRMDFLISGATDFIRGDAPMEGITATMKLAHARGSLGDGRGTARVRAGDPPLYGSYAEQQLSGVGPSSPQHEAWHRAAWRLVQSVSQWVCRRAARGNRREWVRASAGRTGPGRRIQLGLHNRPSNCARFISLRQFAGGTRAICR